MKWVWYSSTVFISKMAEFDILVGQFSSSDWKLMVKSLEFTIITAEELLKKQNASDLEWEKLEDYKALRNDILTFVLGEDK